MPFQVLKTSVIGKKEDQSLCEDHVEITEGYVLLIDGATSKSDMVFDGVKGGKKACGLLLECLHQLPNNLNAHQFVEALTQCISDYYKQLKLVEHMMRNPNDRITAAIAVLSHHYQEVWIVGDAQCLMGEVCFTNEKQIDHTIAAARSLFIQTALADGKSISDFQEIDTGREYVLPLLKGQSAFQNANYDSSYAYGAIDGFPVNSEHILRIPVNSDKIILASDGYLKLFSSFQQSEEYLQMVLEKDPLCYKLHPSTKGLTIGQNSFDDRSWVELVWE